MGIFRPNEVNIVGQSHAVNPGGSKVAPKNGRISPLPGMREATDPATVAFDRRNVFGPVRSAFNKVVLAKSNQNVPVGSSSSLRANNIALNPDRVNTDGSHPLANHIDTATQLSVPPRTSVGNIALRNPIGEAGVPEIQPHERGTFFSTSQLPVVRRAGGPQQGTNTPFHPDRLSGKPGTSTVGQKRNPRPRPRTAIGGERTSAPSFVSYGSLRNHPNHDGGSRWATIKRGAAG